MTKIGIILETTNIMPKLFYFFKILSISSNCFPMFRLK